MSLFCPDLKPHGDELISKDSDVTSQNHWCFVYAEGIALSLGVK